MSMAPCFLSKTKKQDTGTYPSRKPTLIRVIKLITHSMRLIQPQEGCFFWTWVITTISLRCCDTYNYDLYKHAETIISKCGLTMIHTTKNLVSLVIAPCLLLHTSYTPLNTPIMMVKSIETTKTDVSNAARGTETMAVQSAPPENDPRHSWLAMCQHHR